VLGPIVASTFRELAMFCSSYRSAGSTDTRRRGGSWGVLCGGSFCAVGCLPPLFAPRCPKTSPALSLCVALLCFASDGMYKVHLFCNRLADNTKGRMPPESYELYNPRSCLALKQTNFCVQDRFNFDRQKSRVTWNRLTEVKNCCRVLRENFRIYQRSSLYVITLKYALGFQLKFTENKRWEEGVL